MVGNTRGSHQPRDISTMSQPAWINPQLRTFTTGVSLQRSTSPRDVFVSLDGNFESTQGSHRQLLAVLSCLMHQIILHEPSISGQCTGLASEVFIRGSPLRIISFGADSYRS